MSKNNKSLIIKKINFLIDFAISESKNTDFKNPYIYNYIKIAFRLAKKINYRIPASIHMKVCKNCYTLRNIDNTKYKIESRVVNKTKKRYLKLHCLSCDYIKKINVTKEKSI